MLRLINRNLIVLICILFVGCSTKLSSWAQNYDKLKRYSPKQQVKIDKKLFIKAELETVLTGFNDFKFGETQTAFFYKQAISGSSKLFNCKDLLLEVKVVGDNTKSIGCAHIRNNEIVYYLNLNSFYTRSLYYQPLLITSTDDQFFFELPPTREGFSLETFQSLSTVRREGDMNLKSTIARSLAINEIKVIERDNAMKMINNEKSNYYKELLSRLLIILDK